MLKIILAILKSPRWLRVFCFYPLYPVLFLAIRSKVSTRIRAVFPDISESECHALVKQTVKINFDNVIHLLGIPEENYQIHGLDHLKQDQAAVVATMHSGKTDAATWALQQQGYKTLTIIGQGRKANKKLKQFGLDLLNHIGLDYVIRKQGLVFQLLSELKKGKTVFVHSDFRGSGPEVDFCGYRTEVPGTAASLAVLGNAPLLFIYTVNSGRDNQVFIEKIDVPEGFEGSKNELIDYFTQQVALKMEMAIKQHPEQWFWFYNRFKNALRNA